MVQRSLINLEKQSKPDLYTHGGSEAGSVIRRNWISLLYTFNFPFNVIVHKEQTLEQHL